MLAGKNIVLIISGSIAAYKSGELVRELVKSGARVRVILTQGGEQFVTPLTLQTLSGSPVTTDLFNLTQENEIGHIRLADEADVVVVAPATADLIAKMVCGLADSAATAVLLASKAPVVIAPAMNVNMWEKEITQKNEQTLQQRGMHIVMPAAGELACGWHGLGRLAEIAVITEEIERALSKKDLLGMKVVVTAGPTREFFDPIRFISNISSGKMGYQIARVARRRGANVDLITGPTNLKSPEGVSLYQVETALQMQQKLAEVVKKISVDQQSMVFMASAIGDFRPAVVSQEKLKTDKKNGMVVEMLPNPDVLAGLAEIRSEWKNLRLVGFAVETGNQEQLLRSAKEKLKNKNVDLVVANLAHESFEKETNHVWLLDRDGGQLEIDTASKEEIAEQIISVAVNLDLEGLSQRF